MEVESEANRCAESGARTRRDGEATSQWLGLTRLPFDDGGDDNYGNTNDIEDHKDNIYSNDNH